MKTEIGELKRAIAKTPKNASGRRRYGPELRARVVDEALRWRAAGNALSKLAAALGVRDSLLCTWVQNASLGDGQAISESNQRVRRVEVVEESAVGSGCLTMKFPSGAEVVGLSVEDIASLLQRS